MLARYLGLSSIQAFSCFVLSSPNKLAARIFGAVGYSRLRAECTSWSDRGTGVDPTQPRTLALALTLTPTPTQTPNGPEMGEKRGCATLGIFCTIPIYGPPQFPQPMRERKNYPLRSGRPHGLVFGLFLCFSRFFLLKSTNPEPWSNTARFSFSLLTPRRLIFFSPLGA